MKGEKTKVCRHCKEKIDKKAKRCPKCGGKLGIPGWIKAIIIVVIVLVCAVSCMHSCTKAVDDSLKETFGGYDDQNGKTAFNVGETFESKHLKVTFNSSNSNFTNYSKYSSIKKGYKIVQFKFTAENLGTENETFDYTDFHCYADNQTMQQFYGTDDSGLDSGGTISQGKSVSVPVYCEVPKDAKKVSVEFKPLFANKNYEFIAK